MMRHLMTAAGVLAALAVGGGGAAENSGGFRGPNRNGVFPAQGLLKQWPEGGPKLLWEAQIGKGWTSASVAEGKVFFCSQGDPNSAMRAFDLQGQELWRSEYGPDKGPRGTPAVSEGVVYYESVVGVLYALDAATGKVKWSFDANTLGDTLAKCGGNSASPLVHGDLVIIPLRSPGDETPSFAAVNKKTGVLAWKGSLGPCPEKGKGWSAFHSSPIAMQAGETPLIVNQYFRCAAAVRADTGERFWLEENNPKGRKGPKRQNNQPVANEGYLFTFGGRMLKVGTDGTFKELWEGKISVAEYNISYAHTLIKDGRLIAFTSCLLRMLDCETGETLGMLQCGDKGSLLWADGRLYLQDNRPCVMLIEATKDGLQKVSSFRPKLGGDHLQMFTPPVIAEGRLFLRNQSQVLVYDLRASPEAPDK